MRQLIYRENENKPFHYIAESDDNYESRDLPYMMKNLKSSHPTWEVIIINPETWEIIKK